MARRCLFVLFCMLVIACGRESAPPPARPVTPPPAPAPRAVVEPLPEGAGCYDIQWQAKKPLPNYGVALPRAIELTAMPAEQPANAFLIRSRDSVNEHLFAQWQRTAASRLELTWSTGFVGFVISIPSEFKNGAEDGVAQTFADVPEPGEKAKVRVVRVRCEVPGPS
jgi:hypothetical protein